MPAASVSSGETTTEPAMETVSEPAVETVHEAMVEMRKSLCHHNSGP